MDCDDLETMAVLLNTKVGNLRKKISLTAGAVRSEPAWVRKESHQGEVEKKRLVVIGKKYNEISVCQRGQERNKEKEIGAAATKDPSVKTEQTERKRRIGQAEALSSFVNSKLSQKDSKDRI